MKIKLVKLNSPSDELTTFYTVYLNSDDITLFEEFNNKYNDRFNKNRKKQVDIIKLKLISMGLFTGALESLFKPAEIGNEDKVFYVKSSNVRMYCIVLGESLVVIGGGGVNINGKGSKAVNMSLLEENKKMHEVAKLLKGKLENGDIKITKTKTKKEYEKNKYVTIESWYFEGKMILENNVIL